MSSTIKGLDSLFKKLDVIEEVFKSGAMERAVHRGCKTVQAEAKLLCPVDKGELRNSISTKVEVSNSHVIGKVYTNKEYGPYVELGTGRRGAATYDGDQDITYNEEWAGQPAQPFLYPALKNNEKQVLERINVDIRKEIRKVTGNAK
ncbi:MAG: HK97 gp10 family phage protein [Lachnospiraceae bacterium]|nr:HK97 gp10 family phage protein [Lachnospiraceae bacterium]